MSEGVQTEVSDDVYESIEVSVSSDEFSVTPSDLHPSVELIVSTDTPEVLEVKPFVQRITKKLVGVFGMTSEDFEIPITEFLRRFLLEAMDDEFVNFDTNLYIKLTENRRSISVSDVRDFVKKCNPDLIFRT